MQNSTDLLHRSEQITANACVVIVLIYISWQYVSTCSAPWGNLICGPQQAYPQHSKGVQFKLCRSKLCDFRSYYNWPPLTAKQKPVGWCAVSQPAHLSVWWCKYGGLFIIFCLLFFRMRERDLQSMCRRALLLTVCMVSLWGQLTSASSHRSHIGTTLHVFLFVIFFRVSWPNQPKSAATGWY